MKKCGSYKLRECQECKKTKRCRMRVCDNCYHKSRAHLSTEKCSVCEKVRPLNLDKCHTCYERSRRQALAEQAKTDPAVQKRLKDKHRASYIKNKINGNYATISRRISSQLNAFKKRDPNSNIDHLWFFENIVDKLCFYCGIDETTALKFTKNRLHVDRVDPKLGYTKDNCVPACKACNTAKLNFWSKDQMLVLGKVIFGFYQDKMMG